jgi:hypothetical protein
MNKTFLSLIAGIGTLEWRKVIKSEACGRKARCFQTKKNHENICQNRQSLSRSVRREHLEYTATAPIAVPRIYFILM